MSEAIWLIWSNLHGVWWREFDRGGGYTQVIGAATRYPYDRAKKICDGANSYQGAEEIPNEVMVLSPEAAVALLADAEKCCFFKSPDPVHEYPSGELTANEGHATGRDSKD